MKAPEMNPAITAVRKIFIKTISNAQIKVIMLSKAARPHITKMITATLTWLYFDIYYFLFSCKYSENRHA